MPANRMDAMVKDAETFHLKLDPKKSCSIAIATGAANGAAVVLKAYLGINNIRYANPVEMLKPDNSAAAVTDLTGAGKLGVIPQLAKGCTDFWLIRSDADASLLATGYVSVTTE